MNKSKRVKPVGTKLVLVLLAAVLGVGGVCVYLAVENSPMDGGSGRSSGLPFLTPDEAAKNLPATLNPRAFSGPSVAAAYAAAKEMPAILAQEPCHCGCNRMNHRSLLDCFRGEHAADCDICLKEALFAQKQYRLGQSPAQIRNGINQGAWQSIKL